MHDISFMIRKSKGKYAFLLEVSDTQSDPPASIFPPSSLSKTNTSTNVRHVIRWRLAPISTRKVTALPRRSVLNYGKTIDLVLHRYLLYCSEAINIAVLEMSEDGVLNSLKRKWWYDRSECHSGTTKVVRIISKESSVVTLNLSIGFQAEQCIESGQCGRHLLHSHRRTRSGNPDCRLGISGQSQHRSKENQGQSVWAHDSSKLSCVLFSQRITSSK